MISGMHFSNVARRAFIAMLLFGVAELPFAAPQEHSAAPPHNANQQATRIEYRNAQYGFCFSLPASWRGYAILVELWQGHANDSKGDVIVQEGPLISIRHPRWTSSNPRQDIPIMVFTRAQWQSLQHDDFHVSAAPIGPSELGRNRKYLFALPPRYNFAFPTGYEEVDQILDSHPLNAECPARGHQN